MNRRFVLASLLSWSALPASAAVEDIGLVFVGASWCPVCKQAAPVLALFAEQSGLPILVASQDNRPIAPFLHAIPAADHPIARAVRQVPTLLIYDRRKDAIVDQIVGYRTARLYLAQILKSVQVAGTT